MKSNSYIFRICVLLILTFQTAGSVQAEPYPLEYWALRDVVNNVQVSPDGKYLALLKIPNRDSDPFLEVYDASNLDEEPFRMDGGRMEITAYDWVSNDSIVTVHHPHTLRELWHQQEYYGRGWTRYHKSGKKDSLRMLWRLPFLLLPGFMILFELYRLMTVRRYRLQIIALDYVKAAAFTYGLLYNLVTNEVRRR